MDTPTIGKLTREADRFKLDDEALVLLPPECFHGKHRMLVPRQANEPLLRNTRSFFPLIEEESLLRLALLQRWRVDQGSAASDVVHRCPFCEEFGDRLMCMGVRGGQRGRIDWDVGGVQGCPVVSQLCRVTTWKSGILGTGMSERRRVKSALEETLPVIFPK